MVNLNCLVLGWVKDPLKQLQVESGLPRCWRFLCA